MKFADILRQTIQLLFREPMTSCRSEECWQCSLKDFRIGNVRGNFLLGLDGGVSRPLIEMAGGMDGDGALVVPVKEEGG